MIDLNGLWELEKHNQHLNSMRKELNLVEKREELHKMERDFKYLEQSHENLLSKKDSLKLQLRKLEQEVDIHKEKLKIAEKTLYNGSVKDIKQLEHLEKEKAYHKSRVDALEDEIIDMMGKSEDTESKIDETFRQLSSHKGELLARQSLSDKNSTRLYNEIQALVKTIGYLEDEIDSEVLSTYKKIRKMKGSGMALMKNDVCNGCHMHIPEKIVEKAKQGKAVVTCESCGRILYHEPDGDDISV